MKALERWMDVEVFSLQVLCGAVLQIADKGLAVCSTRVRVPRSCRAFARTAQAKFCVGRKLHGLPIGAIVHAGRNQDQHWNDEELDVYGGGFHPFTAGVFHALALAYYGDIMMDLVYCLGNNGFSGPPRSRADSIVLSTLKWKNYDAYIADMSSMLKLRRRRRT